VLLFLFEILDSSTLLLFGVFVSAAILSIPFHKKNTAILLIFCIGVYALQVFFYVTIGYKATEWLYPVITHLPSVLLYCLYYKRKVMSSLFAIMSAYLCCQLSKWLSMLALALTSKLWVVYGIRSVITILLGFLIIRYFALSIAMILTKPFKTVLIFSILPAAYYLFDYIATVYTNLLYSGSEAVFEFLPFVLCVAYLIFSVVYFKEYEEKCEAEQHNQLMKIRQIQSVKEIESIQHSEYEISLIRHDMRHFLSNILAYIQNGDCDKTVAYINEIIDATDQTAPQKFCDNNLVHVVLSSYKNKMKKQNIRFLVSIQIPKALPCADIDFASILANGLENAIQAVCALDPEKREITLDLRMKDNKLLLLIKNPYGQTPEITNGLPITYEPGHGLGTQSIKFTVEKLNGNCQFDLKDGAFMLRVVL